MNREEKQVVVKELNETFKGNNSVLLVDFTGLTVEDSTDLRRKISEVESGYRVIKNRLALRALEDTSVEGLKEHFHGPTAIAYTGGDPVALARVLKAFIKNHPAMSFKAGMVEGQAVSASDVEILADLPSRPQLLTKLLYLLNAPLTRLATALQSPLRNLASVLKQLEEQREKDQPPAAEPAAEEAVPEQKADQVEAPEEAAEPAAEEAVPEQKADQVEAPKEAAEPAAEEAVPEQKADQVETTEEEAVEAETTDQETKE